VGVGYDWRFEDLVHLVSLVHSSSPMGAAQSAGAHGAR